MLSIHKELVFGKGCIRYISSGCELIVRHYPFSFHKETITDTYDDGLPYPDVEDYVIPNTYATPEGNREGRFIYWFKANYEVDQELIDEIIKEEQESWLRTRAFFSNSKDK